MLRGLASRCLEPVNPTRRSSQRRARLLADGVSRRSYERRRRSGDGRKRDAFEERSAANQEEYFRRETARQLQELRERLQKRKAERERELELEQGQQQAKRQKTDGEGGAGGVPDRDN